MQMETFMDIATSLFKGNLIRLTRIEYEKDPEEISRWTHNAAYLRMLGEESAYPLSAFQIKKQLEGIEKSADEERNLFYFHIRLLEEERLLGFAKIDWVLWNSRSGRVSLAIGDPAEHKKGYGADTLRLLLRYAFGELNLHRVFVMLPEYNEAGIHLVQKFGFTQEVCRREVIAREGRRWDMLEFGLLQPEWLEHIK
jgi:RimJ/RimL family protein N-acetyltransferase